MDDRRIITAERDQRTSPREDGWVSLDDAATFQRVVLRHFDLIRRYVLSRVGPTAADDLVSETFAIAYRVRMSFDPAAGVDASPWLLGIATKVIAQHRRAESRWLKQRSAARGLDGDSMPSFDETVLQRVDAQAFGPNIASALARLSRGDRDAFLLNVLCELNYEQIAAALGIPVGTVRSRINRVRRRLATCLERGAS